MLYHAVLYYDVLYSNLLYYTVLYFTTLTPFDALRAPEHAEGAEERHVSDRPASDLSLYYINL